MLNLATKKIIDVKPPLKNIQKISKTNHIGILATNSAIRNKGLTQYIEQFNFPKTLKIFTINASELVELVESGKFLLDKKYCKKIIKKTLKQKLLQNSIDTVTLSSTHLVFLKSLLKKEYPNVNFIEPGNIVAQKIFMKIKNNQTKRNSLKIFTSGNVKIFEKKVKEYAGIENKVNFLSV